MICLEINPSTGALQPVSPQPSDLSSCSLVAGSYTETMSGISQLSPADGSQIAVAILVIWALGWVVRQIARTLNVDSERSES